MPIDTFEAFKARKLSEEVGSAEQIDLTHHKVIEHPA